MNNNIKIVLAATLGAIAGAVWTNQLRKNDLRNARIEKGNLRAEVGTLKTTLHNREVEFKNKLALLEPTNHSIN